MSWRPFIRVTQNIFYQKTSASWLWSHRIGLRPLSLSSERNDCKFRDASGFTRKVYTEKRPTFWLKAPNEVYDAEKKKYKHLILVLNASFSTFYFHVNGSIGIVQKIDFEIRPDLGCTTLKTPRKVVLDNPSVCLSVCPSVCLTVCLAVAFPASSHRRKV